MRLYKLDSVSLFSFYIQSTCQLLRSLSLVYHPPRVNKQRVMNANYTIATLLSLNGIGRGFLLRYSTSPTSCIPLGITFSRFTLYRNCKFRFYIASGCSFLTSVPVVSLFGFRFPGFFRPVLAVFFGSGFCLCSSSS
jgi:hypothetical protein